MHTAVVSPMTALTVLHVEASDVFIVLGEPGLSLRKLDEVKAVSL